MSSKHLSTGSSCPALIEGNLRIYNMKFCPYAQRALLVASAKELPYDVVNCNLKQKPEWLLEKNPNGKVPVLETPEGILYESLIVADYLDEKYPDRRQLRSSNPIQKAKDRLQVERFNSTIRLYYKIVYNTVCSDDSPDLNSWLDQLVSELSYWDSELQRRGTKYFGGSNQPGMVDYMIWPWIERLSIVELFYPKLFLYDDVKRNLPTFAHWEKNMTQDEIVKKHYLSSDIHFTYTSGSRDGTPNYDLLEESSPLNFNSKI